MSNRRPARRANATIIARQVGLSFAVEGGQWADYRALARYHYRAKPPATVCQVWRLVARWAGGFAPTFGRAAGRITGRPVAPSPPRPVDLTPVGPPPLLWRAGGYPTLAGVLVVSYPVLQSSARNRVTGRRYCTWPDRRVGCRRLNREVRTISRVIVHPLYRGLGLAGRFVAAVLPRTGAAFVEAFARMGRYVPFFRQAGMGEVRLPGRPVYYYHRNACQEGSP